MQSPFLALNIPSDKTCLIEASAGTGKTYTMTEIYLRLILGVDCQPLNVEQILVVTFTNAATQELRDRIRERILKAEQLFYRYLDEQQNNLPSSQDNSFERSLFERLHQNEQDLNLATLRLKVAAQDMDLAAIYTIHSFCQKMLSRFSFRSGLPFELDLQPDENELLTRLSQEVWRELYYPLNPEILPLVITHLRSPEQALKQVKHLIGNPQPDNPFAHHFSFADYITQKQQNMAQILHFWQTSGEQLFNDCQQTLKNALNGNKYRASTLEKQYNQWQEWAKNPTSSLPESDMFTQEKMEYAHNQKNALIIPESVTAFQSLIANFNQQFGEKVEKNAFVLHFYQALQNKVDEYKQYNPEKSFNDMLSLLNRALNAEQGEELANDIRQLYQFAMIDEFQDTDIQQYEIFSRLFMNTTPARGFVMIGDPKQSIYKFRGADIATYIKAANQAQYKATLDTNHRSASALVEAVNKLFYFGEQSLHSPLLNKDIPFKKVDSKTQPVLNGAKNVMLYLQADHFDEKLAAIQCAKQIQHQLKQSIKEKTLFIEHSVSCNTLEEAENKRSEFIKKEQSAHRIIPTDYFIVEKDQNYHVIGKKTILPADIAILVTGKTQAGYMRDALNTLGISSVYLSERSNIFESQEASDLYALLQACINPNSQSAILSSLGTLLWAKTAEEIATLQQSESLEWDIWNTKFDNFNKIWQKQGVLAMLHHIFLHENLYAAISQFPNADRRITNFFHLAELLQQASPTVENEHALLHWFKQHLNDVSSTTHEQELRLESEQDLIKIITIHSSKGLQYPVVWLPFVGKDGITSNKKENEKLNSIHHQDNLRWEFELDEQTITKIKQNEENAENLRLLYVALTRAESQLNLILPQRFVGKQNKKARSKLKWNSLLYLMTKGEFTPDSVTEVEKESTAYFDEKNIQYDAVLLSEKNAEVDEMWKLSDYLNNTTPLSAKVMPHRIANNVGNMTSYSQLTKLKYSDNPNYDSEDNEETQTTSTDESQNEMSRFSLAKGAKIGTGLHELLEKHAFQTICADTEDKTKNKDWKKFTQHVKQFCESYLTQIEKAHTTIWYEELLNWFKDIVSTPFGPESMSLKEINNKHRLTEWHFIMRLSNAEALPQLNQLLKQETSLAQKYALADLKLNELQGYIEGFVDCVCLYKGKYYIIDYKSNHLGNTYEDYSPSKLEKTFAQNRFDLQAIFYTLALHRMLRFRLGENYDYSRDVGGVAYLFLRGMDGKTTNSGVYFDKPSSVLIEQLDQLFG